MATSRLSRALTAGWFAMADLAPGGRHTESMSRRPTSGMGTEREAQRRLRCSGPVGFSPEVSGDEETTAITAFVDFTDTSLASVKMLSLRSFCSREEGFGREQGKQGRVLGMVSQLSRGGRGRVQPRKSSQYSTFPIVQYSIAYTAPNV